ncbi:hypothetical protein L2750_10835 [Shewanella submarina]|uniref:Uncharacterized protein n=1 Tax=Shewanella submarina TaxID=2016376 RepID=A0ABV7GCV9_9GAMM|nr:hypothetical protein [Shewanella submarina]MCL1037645.1 hypothetical protein [Shewanella submarina]
MRLAPGRIQRQLSALNKKAKRVAGHSISGARKRQLLDEITSEKNRLYQAGYLRLSLVEY